MNNFPKIESQTVEFKASFNEDVIETLVAFANAKGGTVYAEDIRSSYSIFFFGILLASLAILYLHKKISLARTLFPLVTVFVIMLAVNNRWPYDYPHSKTNALSTLIESYIEIVVEADMNNESVVELRVPKYNDQSNWPIPVSWWGDAFSNTLYRHHITGKIIEIIVVPDESIPIP